MNYSNIEIVNKLKEIEKEFDIKILWAIDAGSRAWGIASKDSDFDIRFIYKRKIEDYIKLNKEADTIEIPICDSLDIIGYDLEKVLRLLYKSNPTMYEWMNSPIKYIDSGFKERLHPILNICFCEKKMLYHYLNMAKKSFSKYINGKLIKPKNYLYIIRSLLACKWVISKRCTPPISFDKLVDSELPEDMKVLVEHLKNLKINKSKKHEIKPIKMLDEYLNGEIGPINEHISSYDDRKQDIIDELNKFFQKEIEL